MKMTTDPIGIYVHIPFCVRKCVYCDFCSFSDVVSSKRKKYIDALCDEIGSYKGKGISVDTVFFGGGTPTLLGGDEFQQVVSKIRECFNVVADAEFTIEANPKTLTEENLVKYIACGVNRVSIGLQTIHEKELKKLGRVHSFEEFLDTYHLVRRLGIKNVSVDLMYGIPEQTRETFSETLDKVISLSPEHISLYGLIVEEGTPLFENISSYRLPSEDEECDMYYLASKKMRDGGYLHYEISNYSKNGCFCRHNLKYWRAEEYIGVGLAAYSYFDGKRYGNGEDIDEYIKDYSLCRVFNENIGNNLDSNKYEFAMLSLRLCEGFSLSFYKEKFGEDFLVSRREVIEKFSELGYLTVKDDRISFTESGLYVSNTLLTELL